MTSTDMTRVYESGRTAALRRVVDTPKEAAAIAIQLSSETPNHIFYLTGNTQGLGMGMRPEFLNGKPFNSWQAKREAEARAAELQQRGEEDFPRLRKAMIEIHKLALSCLNRDTGAPTAEVALASVELFAYRALNPDYLDQPRATEGNAP